MTVQMGSPGTPVHGEMQLSPRMCRWLAGLDTGVWGSLLFVSWLIFVSFLSRDYWWAKLNVAGAFFFGDNVFRMGLSWATIAGAAFLIILYSIVGALMAQLAFTKGFIRNLFLGLILGAAWHLLANRFLWRSIHPFAPSYFPPLAVLPGHLLFGLSLGRFARRFRSIALTYGDPEWIVTLWPIRPAAVAVTAADIREAIAAEPPALPSDPGVIGSPLAAPDIASDPSLSVGVAPQASAAELPPLTVDDPSAITHEAVLAPGALVDPDPASPALPADPIGKSEDNQLVKPQTQSVVPDPHQSQPPSQAKERDTHPSINKPSPNESAAAPFSEPDAPPVPPTKDGQNQ
jgi:hypothetical protein